MPTNQPLKNLSTTNVYPKLILVLKVIEKRSKYNSKTLNENKKQIIKKK